MANLLLRKLLETARFYSKSTGLDTTFIVILVLAAALVVISVIITFLIWLRFLIGAGLIITTAYKAIRWSGRDRGVC